MGCGAGRQAGAEITAAMIEAGVEALWGSGLIPYQHRCSADKLIVEEILRAALSPALTSEHRKPEAQQPFHGISDHEK
jgi:hypothetical protein